MAHSTVIAGWNISFSSLFFHCHGGPNILLLVSHLGVSLRFICQTKKIFIQHWFQHEWLQQKIFLFCLNFLTHFYLMGEVSKHNENRYTTFWVHLYGICIQKIVHGFYSSIEWLLFSLEAEKKRLTWFCESIMGNMPNIIYGFENEYTILRCTWTHTHKHLVKFSHCTDILHQFQKKWLDSKMLIAGCDDFNGSQVKVKRFILINVMSCCREL